jgi:hypothetical protein
MRILAALLIFVLAGPFPFAARWSPGWVESEHITATALPELVGQRFGPLTMVEAWRLESPHSGFGGLSAMALTGDRQFLTASDAGHIVRFTLSRDGGVSDVRIAPLIGVRRGRKSDADMEALWRDPVSGRVWIAFEGSNRISRFTPDLSRIERSVRPWEMRRWPANGGPEAMTRLNDGRFLVLAERAQTRSLGAAGILYPDDVVDSDRRDHLRFGYQAWGMGQLVDAATLPDGRVLLLHRQFDPWHWFASTLAIGDPATIVDRQSWTSRPLAALTPPRISENLEALAIAPHPRGISIWMASDDNFNVRQQTLLLHLLLPTEALPPR